MKYQMFEMAKYTYTLAEVQSEVSKFPMNNNPLVGEIYHAFVGRYDQPDVYDKRPCYIVGVPDNKFVYVYKVTDEYKKSNYRYDIIDNESAGVTKNNQINLSKNPYKIERKWLRTYDGTLSKQDIEGFLKKYEELYYQGYIK